MKILKMVKKLVKEGQLNEAVQILSDFCFENDRLEVNSLFDGRYETGESLLDKIKNVEELDFDLEIDGTYYETHYDKKVNLTVKEITKDYLLETIKIIEEMEK